MKKITVAGFIVLTLLLAGIFTAHADPQLVIGKTVATPRVITVIAQASSTASGQLLRDTLGAITDADSFKPYVIRLEPGIYSLGGTGLAMKEWVTIAGSGQNNTWISGGTASTATGVVIAASNSGLRDLTVSNSNQGVTNAVGVYAVSVTSFALDRVKIFATKAVGGSKSPVNRGLYLKSSIVTVTSSFIQATTHSLNGGFSYCVYNDDSALDMRDTTLKAYATGSGSARGIYNLGASPALFHVIIESKWQGEDLNGEAVGILNAFGSNPGLYDVMVTAVADSHLTDIRAVGLDNLHDSSPIVTGSTIIAQADGGAIAVGMRAKSASNPQLHSTVVRAEAFGGSAYALFTTQHVPEDPSGTVQINSSSLIAVVTGGGAGSRVALTNNTHYTVDMGSTLVDGSVLNSGGSVNCQACYDGDYHALNDSCL